MVPRRADFNSGECEASYPSAYLTQDSESYSNTWDRGYQNFTPVKVFGLDKPPLNIYDYSQCYQSFTSS